MPVPGPIMMVAASGFSGTRKCFAVWTKTGTLPFPSARSAKNVEQTPRCKWLLRSGW